MFTIALIEPKIPPNTGNIARLCGATKCRLDLVGELGFSIDDKQVRRAGLDYWEFVEVNHYPNREEYLAKLDPERIHLLTTKAKTTHFEASFQPGDTLIFGAETSGLSDEILTRWPNRQLTIPMASENIRSLNLSNSVSIVLYEAIRQVEYT